MEKFILSLVGETWAIIALVVFTGILMSFLTEAIYLLTPDAVKLWYVTLFTAIVIGVGSVFLFPLIVITWQDKILTAFFNVSFAIVFSKLAGKKVVEFLISKVTKKVEVTVDDKK